MTHPRDALHDRIADDIETFAAFGEINPVSDDEIEAVLDEYDAESVLDERYEKFGESFTAVHPLFRVFERRGIALRHDEKWADAELALETLADYADVDREIREIVDEMAEQHRGNAPTGYDDLLETYVATFDDVLAGLSWIVRGDRVAGETVHVVCERDGKQIEATLNANDETIDVEGLLALLNDVIAETTDDDRRFAWLEPWAIFVDDVELFDNYLSFARNSVQRHLQTEE